MMGKGASLETIRRYNAGEITERQACDWFGVDRLTFRTALAGTVGIDPEVAAVDAAARAVLQQEWEQARRDYNEVCRVRDIQWAQMKGYEAEIERLKSVGLDVERLARALIAVRLEHPYLDAGDRELAAAIIRAYGEADDAE